MKTQLTRIILLLAVVATTAIGCSGFPTIAAPAPADTSAAATPTPAPTATPDARANTNPNPRGDSPKDAAPKGTEALTRLGVELGVVNQVSSDSLTLRTRGGSETFQLSAATLVVVPGQTSAQVTDLKRGERALVKKDNADETAADLVLVIPANLTLANLALGQIESAANGALTLKTKNGSQTVTTTATTVVVKFEKDKATLGAPSDLQNGALAMVVRDSNSDNAQIVIVVAGGKGGRAPQPKNK